MLRLFTPSPKINIAADKVHALSGLATAAASFDGNTATAWFPGWASNAYPARCLVDLGRPYSVEQIRVFDGTGITPFRVFASDASGVLLKKVLDLNLGLYETWQDASIPPTVSQYWVFEITEAVGDSPAPEIEMYGNPSGEGPVEPPAPPPPPVPVKPGNAGAAIGSNTFPWVPLEKSLPLLRVYISSGWIVTPKGLFIEPMNRAQTPGQGYGLDTYLTAAKEKGIDAYLCVHQTPEWYMNTGRGDGANDNFPVKPGGARFLSSGYDDYAEWIGQIAKRYGRKTWPADSLRVDPTPRWAGDSPNEKKSGLNLLNYIEPWNEEKWWRRGTPEYVEPEAMAALMAAVWDSVKAADPSMKLVMPGLSGYDMPYLEKMDSWFAANKGGKWPCDVINLHHYENRGNKAGQWPPTWYAGGAVCPELDSDFSTFSAVVQFARARGKQVWVTECGYDTQPTPDGQNLSWQYPMPVPGKTSQQLQADWLVRTYLEYIRLGCDKTFMFNACDEPGFASGGLYQSCGLLGSQAAGYAPKPSYSAVAGLIAALDGYTFTADRSTPTIRVMEFVKGRNNRYLYWSPTAGNIRAQAVIAGRTVTAVETVQYFDVKSRWRIFPKDTATGKVAGTESK